MVYGSPMLTPILTNALSVPQMPLASTTIRVCGAERVEEGI